MSEETNPIIAMFLKLQEKNALTPNIFEAAKKAKKDYDGDGKVESPKDEVWGSRFRAAKAAGKMEEAALKDPKDPSVQGSGDVTMEPAKPAAPVHVKPTNPERIKNLKDPRDPSVQGSGDVTYKEEVEFSQAEIDHINSFFEAVAPNRPEPTKGVNLTVRNTDLTDETLDELKQSTVLSYADKVLKQKFDKKVEPGHKDRYAAYTGDKESDKKSTRLSMRTNAFRNLAVNKAHNEKPGKRYPEHKLRTGDMPLSHNAGSRKARVLATNEEYIEEGRPKKNPTPEATERDARQHIQVQAGRAAGGTVVDFKHDNGKISKLTPGMGRSITAHLNGLKPAERQEAVKRMHASPEGLKV